LFSQGDAGDGFFAVISGRIRISSSSPDGQEIHITEFGPGDTFGEIALIDGGPRTATAMAATNAELFKIRRGSFVQLLGDQPDLCFQLLVRLCERVRWTSELVEDLTFLDVPAQLAKRLSLLARHLGTEVPGGVELRLSQSELADFLGISRQAVNTHLQTWSQRGWLELTRGRVMISNMDGLSQIFGDTS